MSWNKAKGNIVEKLRFLNRLNIEESAEHLEYVIEEVNGHYLGLNFSRKVFDVALLVLLVETGKSVIGPNVAEISLDLGDELLR